MAKTELFDVAEHLDSPEMIAEYLSAALETGDADYVSRAIGHIAKAQGMTSVARDAGVSRENLYRALDGNTKPELGTIMKVLSALNLQLSAHPKTPVAA